MEDGYSESPAEVGRLAAELVAVGAAGINLEDGSGAPDLLVEKIKAIRSALKGAPLFINARTDVYLRKLKVDGTPAQASIARLKLYQQAGADGAFVPGLTALPEVEEISAAITMPLNVMAMPGLPAIAALQAAGARRVSVGPSPLSRWRMSTPGPASRLCSNKTWRRCWGPSWTIRR
jgi:2-methylisocitrate lyase-like PEP mutase family enzyme